MTTAAPRKHPLRFKLLALGVALAATLLLCEIGMRVFLAATAGKYNLDSASESAAPRDPNAALQTGDLVRADAANHRIPYRGKANLAGVFRGAPLTMNAEGFRGDLAARPKPAGTFRIVASGDSVLFGWGVADDETALAVLTRHMNESRAEGDPEFDAVNLALPGYNAVNEAEVLATAGEEFEPDLLIVQLNSNDFELPGFLRTAPNYAGLDRSFLLDFALSAVGRRLDQFGHSNREQLLFMGEALAAEGVRDPRSFANGDGRNRDVRGDVPAKYADLVGEAAYRAALARLAEHADARGIPVAAIVYDTRADAFALPDPTAEYDRSPFVQPVREHGFAEARLNHWERRFRDDTGASILDVSVAPPDDFHPTAVRHELAALALYETLVREKAIPGAERRAESLEGELEGWLARIEEQYRARAKQ